MESKEITTVGETLNSEAKVDENIETTSVVETAGECNPQLTQDTSKMEKSREGEGEGYSGSEDSDSNQTESQGVKIPKERRSYYESAEKYRKTLRLSSSQIVRKLL